MKPQVDARQLVAWLGTEGAKAGLTHSKQITIDALKPMARSLDIHLPEKTTRSEWISEIVKAASRRIDKSIEDLFRMSQKDLVTYFEQIDVDQEELLQLLRTMDLKPPREGYRSLIEFAARELSETGRYMRIAGQGNNPTSSLTDQDDGGKHDAQKHSDK